MQEVPGNTQEGWHRARMIGGGGGGSQYVATPWVVCWGANDIPRWIPAFPVRKLCVNQGLRAMYTM
jgi:hypothetical protein